MNFKYVVTFILTLVENLTRFKYDTDILKRIVKLYSTTKL